ncbi:hypothetical protein [Moorena sp. SIO3H5]|nr:hypothetical protein [Moorena sp. SIO3H5]
MLYKSPPYPHTYHIYHIYHTYHASTDSLLPTPYSLLPKND